MRTDFTYTVFPVEGLPVEHRLNSRASLSKLQEWVGGYIQIVQLEPRQWAVINEEGAIHRVGKPPVVNPHFITTPWGPLYGTVVLLPKGCRT